MTRANLPRRMGRSLIALTVAGLVLCGPPAPSHAQGVDGAVGVAELSPAAEAAIDRGLRYLAGSQNADGSWGDRYQPACTALALMAFMVQGHFPEQGPHGAQLARAVDYLVERGRANDGYLGGNHHGMYGHGLATLALSEVWGQSTNPQVKTTLKEAVQVIFKAQHSSGGWRYEPRPTSHDISVTVMQIVALASAKEAGIYVPDGVIADANRYVKACQNPFEGGFGYTPNGRHDQKFARSAAGVLALMLTGDRHSRQTQRGLDYLKREGENSFDNTDFYYYAHYYAVQSMYQAGDRHYQEWYPRIREALISKQQGNGRWRSGRGPDAYATGMAILTLGVPYRYLPIYQR